MRDPVQTLGKQANEAVTDSNWYLSDFFTAPDCHFTYLQSAPQLVPQLPSRILSDVSGYSMASLQGLY